MNYIRFLNQKCPVSMVAGRFHMHNKNSEHSLLSQISHASDCLSVSACICVCVCLCVRAHIYNMSGLVCELICL